MKKQNKIMNPTNFLIIWIGASLMGLGIYKMPIEKAMGFMIVFFLSGLFIGYVLKLLDKERADKYGKIKKSG